MDHDPVQVIDLIADLNSRFISGGEFRCRVLLSKEGFVKRFVHERLEVEVGWVLDSFSDLAPSHVESLDRDDEDSGCCSHGETFSRVLQRLALRAHILVLLCKSVDLEETFKSFVEGALLARWQRQV